MLIVNYYYNNDSKKDELGVTCGTIWKDVHVGLGWENLVVDGGIVM
jgi:hypothetical protein